MKITSIDNKNIKHALQVQDTKFVQKYGECFVESEKVVNDLLAQGKKFSTLFVEENKESKYSSFNGDIFTITKEISKKLSNTVTTGGVFGIVKISNISFNKPGKHFLVLDRIQDPTNVGAIIRSAVAFGYDEIYMIDCAYPFSAKVVRASMGHVFNVKINTIKEQDFIEKANFDKLYLVSANMNGKTLNQDIEIPKVFGIVMGNEGQGVSKTLQELCKQTVTIPMSTKVESLNVAVSASIIMYNLNK